MPAFSRKLKPSFKDPIIDGDHWYRFLKLDNDHIYAYLSRESGRGRAVSMDMKEMTPSI